MANDIRIGGILDERRMKNDERRMANDKCERRDERGAWRRRAEKSISQIGIDRNRPKEHPEDENRYFIITTIVRF